MAGSSVWLEVLPNETQGICDSGWNLASDVSQVKQMG